MKNLLVFLALLPCTVFASGFGDESAGRYLLMFAVAFAIMVTAPLGLLGGFVSSFFSHNRNAGFLWVSVVLAGIVFLLPGMWRVDAGLSGFVIYLFLECFLIYSFLAGWVISECLRKKFGRSNSRFQGVLTKWLPMSSHSVKQSCVRRSMRGISIQPENAVGLKIENCDSHGLLHGTFELPNAMPGISWIAMFIPGFLISNAVGIYFWLVLGDLSVWMCPSDGVWHGVSGNTYCRWPLYVFFAKDMVGASVLAILVILVCNAVVPSFKIAAAFLAGIMEALVAIWFLFESYNPLKHILLHRVVVSVAFLVALLFGVIAISLWQAKNRHRS